MWLVILLSSKSCCRLWSGYIPGLLLLHGLISTLADFPIFSALTAASTSSRKIGWYSLLIWYLWIVKYYWIPISLIVVKVWASSTVFNCYRFHAVLVSPCDLHLERAAVVWAILERIAGFGRSLDVIDPRYLKLSTDSSLWPFILICLWKPFGLIAITFVLSGPISILYLVVVVSRRSTRTPASSSSSAVTTMSSAKRKLVISRPSMLTLPSWSSNASHIILSRKMLKRVGESRCPCRPPTVFLNQSSVLPMNRTAPALSHRFWMTRTMLTLMLYFLIVARKASCHTLSNVSFGSRFSWCGRSPYPPSFMPVRAGPWQQNSKEEPKPLRWDTIGDFWTFPTKTMWRTRRFATESRM